METPTKYNISDQLWTEVIDACYWGSIFGPTLDQGISKHYNIYRSESYFPDEQTEPFDISDDEIYYSYLDDEPRYEDEEDSFTDYSSDLESYDSDSSEDWTQV